MEELPSSKSLHLSNKIFTKILIIDKEIKTKNNKNNKKQKTKPNIT